MFVLRLWPLDVRRRLLVGGALNSARLPRERSGPPWMEGTPTGLVE